MLHQGPHPASVVSAHCPAAHTSLEERAATAKSCRSSVPGSGWPRCSTESRSRARSACDLFAGQPPAAHTWSGATASIPYRALRQVPGLGLEIVLHPEPFQCSVSVWGETGFW